MGIYIKGMKMPKDGECIVVSPDGTVSKYQLDNVVLFGGAYNKTEDVIELPPHGRLIDADALIVDLMDRGVEGVQTDDLHEVQQTIMDAPTIIPAEGGADNG